MSAPLTFVLVTVETPHFEFRGCGRTEADARAQLRGAWQLHCSRTDADPAYLDPAEDGNVCLMSIPGATIDDELVKPSPAAQPAGDRVASILEALELLRRARALLRQAGAVRAAEYVARSMKSTEGAIRHARRMEAQRREPNVCPHCWGQTRNVETGECPNCGRDS